MKTMGADILRLWTVAPTTPRTSGSATRSWPARPMPIAGCATRCATCSAISPSSTGGGAAAVRADAGAGALGAAPPGRARPAGARGQRGVRLPAPVLGAAQFLRDRPVGVLFRRAQGLRSTATGRTAAAGAPRGRCSTSCSTASTRLARAGPGVHRRGGLARPASRPRTTASICGTFPEVPAAWRDPALGARWERIATGPPGRHRRARGRAPGEADRLRRSRRAPQVFVTGADAAALRRRRPRRAVHHQRHRRARGRAAPAGAFTLDDVPGIGVVPAPPAGEKCARCWQVLPEVGERGRGAGPVPPLHAMPSRRCAAA